MKITSRSLTVTLLLGSALVQTPAPAQSLDAAGRELRPMVYQDIRNKAYCEIFLVRPPTATGELFADVYGTTRYNDCPKDKLAAIDLPALAKSMGAVRAIANERRYWMPDEYRFQRAGEKRDLAGLDMDWIALFRVPPTMAAGSTLRVQPFVGTHIARDTEKLYRKGKTVLEVISPDGRNWIMQSGIDVPITLAHLGELPDKLALPEGWSFRVRTLNKDLLMRAVDGKAEVLQDTMKNVFDACNPGVCVEQ